MRHDTIASGWGVLALAALIVAGCAAGPTPRGERPASPQAAQPPQAVTADPGERLRDEERLHDRVAQYWDARVRGDILETYQLHEPAFRRAVTLTAFLQGRGMTTVLGYVILGHEMQGNLAVVRMKINSSVRHPAMIRPSEPRWYEFEEQWVRVDGDWHRKFRFPVGDPYPPVDWDELTPGRETPGPPTDR
jgi:hypothetical protein